MLEFFVVGIECFDVEFCIFECILLLSCICEGIVIDEVLLENWKCVVGFIVDGFVDFVLVI